MNSSKNRTGSVSVMASETEVTGTGSKRGRRPLEVPESGTITNRRRMQNRMAQRAYRQRKESAIDILKRKVLELEKSKENMGKEFINLTSVMLQQDSIKNCPQIVEHIKQSTISLLSSAADDDDNEKPDEQDEEQNEPSGGLAANSSADFTPTVQLDQDFGFHMTDSNVHTGYSIVGTAASSQPMPNSNSDSTPGSFNVGPCIQIPANQTQFYDTNRQLPGSTWNSSLPIPRSYAAHEETFGRRYHRAAQEGAYLLASMRHSPPAWYRKVFGFCMHFETREEICSRLGEALRKSRDETLNHWRFPFTNIGGAGLFYPEQGYDNCEPPIGNRFLQHEAYRPSEMSGFSMGPFGPSIEEIRDLRLNNQLRVIDPEYDGDFFDADETEICLRAYGVTIPAGKDFVTAYIDMGMFDKAPDSETSSESATPPATGTNFIDLDEPISFHCPAGMLGMAMGAMPPPPPSKGPGEQWKDPSLRATKVKIDVDRLIMCLVNSTVCLGRTPGVRPLDIRKSLKMAIIGDD
ncbi:hypothetical protein F53441_5705 [Fusarium austroafricanum]|uniref:BZIP domain-containing protein n=1 Tax=Fusarium austroafricanum TaxID=2364996 RepID=A0A8H4KL73_9HYPO|nr:hypothetical protein F53441_5705 [Fusarium austroafricanum]